MITSSVVTIVVNGTLIPSSAPARIIGGRVVAPLAPIVVRLAARTVYAPGSATVLIERGGLRIVVPVLFVEDDIPYVELGPVVRRIGGSATFDSPTKTLAIVLPSPDLIATPAPYNPAQPAVSPSAVFTPAPPPPTSRPIETGIPRPRRTAIPVTPSQPRPPTSPDADPTGPRR
jgi:hypothetical protein